MILQNGCYRYLLRQTGQDLSFICMALTSPWHPKSLQHTNFLTSIQRQKQIKLPIQNMVFLTVLFFSTFLNNMRSFSHFWSYAQPMAFLLKETHQPLQQLLTASAQSKPGSCLTVFNVEVFFLKCHLSLTVYLNNVSQRSSLLRKEVSQSSKMVEALYMFKFQLPPSSLVLAGKWYADVIDLW